MYGTEGHTGGSQWPLMGNGTENMSIRGRWSASLNLWKFTFVGRDAFDHPALFTRAFVIPTRRKVSGFSQDDSSWYVSLCLWRLAPIFVSRERS